MTHFYLGDQAISLELIKLDISNLDSTLNVTSTAITHVKFCSMGVYPESHNLLNFLE